MKNNLSHSATQPQLELNRRGIFGAASAPTVGQSVPFIVDWPSSDLSTSVGIGTNTFAAATFLTARMDPVGEGLRHPFAGLLTPAPSAPIFRTTTGLTTAIVLTGSVISPSFATALTFYPSHRLVVTVPAAGQRPTSSALTTRRVVSFAEARQRALAVLKAAEQRRNDAAEEEARIVRPFFDDLEADS